MNLSTETVSETRKKIVVDVTVDEIKAEERAALREVSSQAKIPGFRPGKAPEKLLRQRYGSVITEETTRKIVSKAYKKVQEENSGIFGLVDVGEIKLNEGEPVSVEFTVDFNPEFELPNYEGLETKVAPVKVTDEDVENDIAIIRRGRAEFEVVEREAQAGDYVKVSYRGSIDGQPIAEIVPDEPIWGTQENTWEEAGPTEESIPNVPAVAKGVIGMKAGDTKEVTQEFGEDHEVEALRGKTGTYTLEVHEVRERKLPEINEEFLKSLGVESEEQLKERVREQLTNRATTERRQSQREQILQALLAEQTFEVPESAIEQKTQEVMERVMRDNLRRGVSEEEFEKHKEELYQQSRNAAVAQLRRDFILFRIAEKEGVKVDNDDMYRAIMTQAMRFRVRPDDIVKELRKDKDALNNLRRDIVLDKTLEFITEKANIVETEETAEETKDEGHSH